MDADVCNNCDEAAVSQFPQPSAQLPKQSVMVPPSTPPSPSSPLCHSGSSSLSATSSSEDLLASAEIEHVDSFLRDALNSRNRITVLRLDLEVEKFVKNPKKMQLLLNPMPSSYERLVAHRIAQHYNVQSMALDSGNPSAPWVLLVKTPNSRLPDMKLADIPFEASNETKSVSPPPGKVAIKQRARQGAIGNESMETGRSTPARSVEERMEEYNKARARIFNNEDNRNRSDESLAPNEAMCSDGSERDAGDNDFLARSSSTVAVFRDREKDMKDPDYDRGRYTQSTRTASLNLSMTPSLCTSAGPSSSLITQSRPAQVQRQASYSSACDNHGCVWFGASVSPVVGYPNALPYTGGQNLHPRHSNVHPCNEEYVYSRHYSYVDWRQDPSKNNSYSMLSSHHTGWFQNF